MPWHKTQLVNPEYTRVDLVKEGANSQAHIKLFKSKGGEQPMDLKEILAKLKPEHADIIQKALEDMEATKKKSEDDKMAAEEEVAKLRAEQAPAPGTSEEEILKTVKDPAVKALLETQIAKAKAAEAIAKQMQDAKDEAEAVAKAKEVPGIGAEEAKLAEVYKKLKHVDATLCEDVFGIFKAANAMISEGGVFTEVGKSAGSNDGGAADENSAWAQIEKAAEEITKTLKISKSAAITKAIKDNPALYNQYLKAQVGN